MSAAERPATDLSPWFHAFTFWPLKHAPIFLQLSQFYLIGIGRGLPTKPYFCWEDYEGIETLRINLTCRTPWFIFSSIFDNAHFPAIEDFYVKGALLNVKVMAICALLLAIYLDRVSIHTEFVQELLPLVLNDLDHQGETPRKLNNDLPCIQTKSIKPAILIHWMWQQKCNWHWKHRIDKTQIFLVEAWYDTNVH